MKPDITDTPISPDGIRQLYAYHWWANRRAVETASRLGAAELDRELRIGHGSLRGTLVHMLWADWIWLERWLGRSPTTMLSPDDFPSLTGLSARWSDVERGQKEFLDGLTVARLTALVAYRNTRGERWEYPLWRQLVHVVNHGSFHRGQVAAFTRQFGVAPLATDLLDLDDEAHATA